MKREYECPECSEDVEVDPDKQKQVQCPHCKVELTVNVDAEWEDGCWHDLTTLRKAKQ